MSVIKFSPEGDILKLYSWSSIKERGKKKKRTFYLPSWNYQDVTVSMTSQSSKCKKQNQCPFLKDCSRTDMQLISSETKKKIICTINHL